MAALTLYEYASVPKPLVAGVAKVLRENSKFMDVLQFPTTSSLGVKVVREGSMPSVSWRRIGNAHSSAKATKPDEIEETGYSIGNYIEVDKVYMMDQSARLYNPMTYQTKMTVKSIARNFTNAAINGLPTDVDNPVGLWWRVQNDLASSQRVTADPAGGSSGLDISPDAASLSTNAKVYFDKLDELLYAVTDSVEAEGGDVYFLCNDTMLLRHQAVARQSGMLDVTQDTIGRRFMTYKGARFIDMGFKSDDSTRIIGNVETLSGSALTTGTGTSIYAIKTGPEYFTAWQMYGLDVTDPKLTDDQVTYRSVIDWFVGLALSNPRSAARLYGLVAA